MPPSWSIGPTGTHSRSSSRRRRSEVRPGCGGRCRDWCTSSLTIESDGCEPLLDTTASILPAADTRPATGAISPSSRKITARIEREFDTASPPRDCFGTLITVGKPGIGLPARRIPVRTTGLPVARGCSRSRRYRVRHPARLRHWTARRAMPAGPALHRRSSRRSRTL